MSVESWMAEFYPVAADDVVAMRDALTHSLTKWTGALPQNCAKHGVTYFNHCIFVQDVYGGRDRTQPFVGFASNTCALCTQHLDRSKSPESQCATCPFVVFTGVDCDNVFEVSGNDPHPMISTLNVLIDADKKAERL